MSGLEEKLEKLEQFLADKNKISKVRKFVEYGRELLKNIRSGNYSEAGLVMESFKTATLTMSDPAMKKEDLKALIEYIGLTIDISRCLPQEELDRGRRELYED